MSNYAERRDDLLADIVGAGFEGWQQSLVDEFVAECEQPAWLAAWGAEYRFQGLKVLRAALGVAETRIAAQHGCAEWVMDSDTGETAWQWKEVQP